MLIDTSGWFCLFDDSDPRNEAALTLYQSATQAVTHSFVLAELVALGISRKRGLPQILAFVEDILNDTEIRTIWVDEAITWQSIRLLNSRSDKKWSMCDAVSFVIMESLDISEALTTDRHFEQAGFIKLLES